jgi:hypothetical protein
MQNEEIVAVRFPHSALSSLPSLILTSFPTVRNLLLRPGEHYRVSASFSRHFRRCVELILSSSFSKDSSSFAADRLVDVDTLRREQISRSLTSKTTTEAFELFSVLRSSSLRSFRLFNPADLLPSLTARAPASSPTTPSLLPQTAASLSPTSINTASLPSPSSTSHNPVSGRSLSSSSLTLSSPSRRPQLSPTNNGTGPLRRSRRRSRRVERRAR